MNLIASIMSLGGPDLIVILLIVLVLFGAKKLPDLARGMGQAMKEFQKAKDDFGHELNSSRNGAGNPEQPRDSVAEIAEAAYRRQESIK